METIWVVLLNANILTTEMHLRAEDRFINQRMETIMTSIPSFDYEINSTEFTEKYANSTSKNSTYASVNFHTSQQSTKSAEINFKHFLEYRVYDFVKKYTMLLTSIPGIFTNPLTIVVSLKIRPHTTLELCMITLGTTDLFVITFRLLIYSMETFEVPLTDQLCRCLLFLANLMYVFSNWILVCWTIERCIAVIFPIKNNVWCSVQVMRRALCGCFILCGISLSSQIIFSYRSSASDYVCVYRLGYYKIYSHIETLIYIYVPLAIIIVCNSAIIVRIKHVTKQRLSLTSKNYVIEKHSKQQRQMCRVLISVCLIFVLLHFTQILAKIWQAMYPDVELIKRYSIRKYILFYIFIQLGYQLTDFQNSVNFFLYCAFGSTVRNMLKTIFKFKSRKKGINVS